MARKVVLNNTGPIEVKPSKESAWVCGCGLSKNFPFCDGTHKCTEGEDLGKVYEYDSKGHRKQVK